MTFKSAAASFGNGILAVGTAMHNSGLQSRIDEIDTEVEALQARIDELMNERSNLVDRQI